MIYYINILNYIMAEWFVSLPYGNKITVWSLLFLNRVCMFSPCVHFPPVSKNMVRSVISPVMTP